MERYFVVNRDSVWKINLDGRYLGQYPTQGVALSAARRLAKQASEHGRPAKVLVEGLSKKIRREGTYYRIDAPRPGRRSKQVPAPLAASPAVPLPSAGSPATPA